MTKKKAERGSLEFYLRQKYPVTVYPDSDGGFVAEIKDLPGCITQGDTVEEVFTEIEDARNLWIETAFEHGDDIPLPSTETQYSGKTLLRMPRSLHKKLAEGSEKEGISLNQYIVSLLSEAIGAKATEPLEEKIDAIYSSFCKATTVPVSREDYLLADLLKGCDREQRSNYGLSSSLFYSKVLENLSQSSTHALVYWLTSLPTQNSLSVKHLENLLHHKEELKVIEDKVQELVKKTGLDREEAI